MNIRHDSHFRCLNRSSKTRQLPKKPRLDNSACLALIGAVSMLGLCGIGQLHAAPPATPNGANVSGADNNNTGNREKRLAQYLTGATFTGKYTVDGKADANPKAESYKIGSCEYLGEGDRYRMKVKIRYGDVDGEFPMDLQILWSGSTPIITLDSVWIPGLGTFSSRVLIHDGRYAGTWQHDEKGGHLFGEVDTTAVSKERDSTNGDKP